MLSLIVLIGLISAFCNQSIFAKVLNPHEESNLRPFSLIGCGYDLIKGNPEHPVDNSGIDPGYKLARKIIEHSYTSDSPGIINGKNIKIPDQMKYFRQDGCGSTYSRKFFLDSSLYQKALDTSVSAGCK